MDTDLLVMNKDIQNIFDKFIGLFNDASYFRNINEASKVMIDIIKKKLKEMLDYLEKKTTKTDDENRLILKIKETIRKMDNIDEYFRTHNIIIQGGNNNYYNKYIKYKGKYLRLKKMKFNI